MKDRLWGLVRLLIILVGVGILVYPSVSEYLSEKNSSMAVSTYDDSIRRMEQAHMEELRAQAEAYNQRLAENNGFSKPALDEYNNPITPEDYWDILDVDGNGMMGYISIPRINVTIPVYHGTSEEVLQVAVGHMQNTSLPVGGENTHAVLSGHRGLPSKALFTDLDQVQVGDLFSLTVLNETLYYRVDQILTVLPNETDALAIEKGKDYVTLVTCTPYGVNSHRLCMVATLEESQGELQYQTLPAYSFADCDWTQCSASQLREKALQLAPNAQKRKDFAATQQTDANGTVIFRDLTPGLYLVIRTKPASENTAYTSDPFLVSIPTVVNGTSAYQVVAEPKFSWDSKPSKPAVPSLKPDSSLPQTGQLNWPIPILIAMGLSLILLGGWLQRKSDHEK